MFDDQSPIYRQIADRIKSDVVRSVPSGDEQVMSTNQYAEFYRIREAFFTAIVDPMVTEARTIGIPLSDVIARLQRLAGSGGPADKDDQ